MEVYGSQQNNGAFTPPIHVIVSLDQAIKEFLNEGGQLGRGRRYARNCKTLVDGMREMGFETLLPDELQAPIIITFHKPEDPKFHFETFYNKLAERGYLIYPGKLTVAGQFQDRLHRTFGRRRHERCPGGHPCGG